MFKAYKYRIYPTNTQQNMFFKAFGCAKFVTKELEDTEVHFFKECPTQDILTSYCGKINKEFTFKDREWVCVGCSTKYNRDVNAAMNIKNFGIRNKPSVSKHEALACT